MHVLKIIHEKQLKTVDFWMKNVYNFESRKKCIRRNCEDEHGFKWHGERGLFVFSQTSTCMENQIGMLEWTQKYKVIILSYIKDNESTIVLF